MKRKPFVIFINGPSSAGKTSLTHAIQELSEIPFLQIGIDKIIGLMPKKHNDFIKSYHPNNSPSKEGFWFESEDSINQKLISGPYAQKVSTLLLNIAETIIEQEHNLIVDEIVLTDSIWKQWQNILAPYQTIFIGITCHDNILTQREQIRKNRMLGSAITQSKLIHIKKQYNLLLDSTSQSSETLAQIVLKHLFEKYSL
ncbi:hypothetical protein COB28_02105 [Candidatus Dependentiae bacterium]|nr:MAG: hypothetical protein COB28_02105 [Candidatus Dependentiae bacterium]